MTKKIYTILVLLFNVIVRRRHYKLSFVAETNEMGKLWYYDFKHWGFDHHNLLMVSGADALCELYSKGTDKAVVDIVASRKERNLNGYDHYIMKTPVKEFDFIDRICLGRDYKEDNGKRAFWICPVTLFVLGRYPKHIYIKRT